MYFDTLIEMNITNFCSILMIVLLGLVSSPMLAQPTSVQGAIAAGSSSAQNPVVIGGVDPGGVARNHKLSPSGYASGGVTGAGQDGFSNGQVLYLLDPNDVAGFLQIGPMIYNRSSGAWDRQSNCSLRASGSLTTTSPVVAISLASGKITHICSISITSSSANHAALQLTTGTGSICATGLSTLTVAYYVPAYSSFQRGGNVGLFVNAPVSSDVCATNPVGSASNIATYEITYDQY